MWEWHTAIMFVCLCTQLNWKITKACYILYWANKLWVPLKLADSLTSLLRLGSKEVDKICQRKLKRVLTLSLSLFPVCGLIIFAFFGPPCVITSFKYAKTFLSKWTRVHSCSQSENVNPCQLPLPQTLSFLVWSVFTYTLGFTIIQHYGKIIVLRNRRLY